MGRQLKPWAAGARRAPSRGSGCPEISTQSLQPARHLPALALLRKEQGYDLDFIIYVADFIMFHVLSCFLPLQFHSSLWGH